MFFFVKTNIFQSLNAHRQTINNEQVLNYKIFACRDHLGVKPLFYYLKDDDLIISSEIKAILMYIGKCVVDKTGIKELLGLGPSLSPGSTLYKDIYSLRPISFNH